MKGNVVTLKARDTGTERLVSHRGTVDVVGDDAIELKDAIVTYPDGHKLLLEQCAVPVENIVDLKTEDEQ